MKELKKLVAVATVAAGAFLPMTSHAVLVDGVTFNAGDQFITTSLWETALTHVSEELIGVGVVSNIGCSACGGTTWTDGQNNTQLTYHFSGYKVARWYDATGLSHSNTDNAGFANAVAIDFTGGTVRIFSDLVIGGGAELNAGARPEVVDPSGIAADIAAVTDGNLWIEYVGVDTTSLFPFIGSRTGSILANGSGANSVHVGGNGFGYLNITGNGLAAANFDTNSFNIGGVMADARFESTFSTDNSNAWPLSGSAAFKTAAIPEPSSLALFAVALVGLGSAVRRWSMKDSA